MGNICHESTITKPPPLAAASVESPSSELPRNSRRSHGPFGKTTSKSAACFELPSSDPPPSNTHASRRSTLFKHRGSFFNFIRKIVAAQKNDELKHLEFQGPCFSLKMIKAATQNFNPKNMVGKGGFGSVYKGTLPNGTAIAVKVLSSTSRQGAPQFITEVSLLLTLRHRHLVRLLGYCTKGNRFILIYEFMENNSLAHILFGSLEVKVKMDWATRCKICLGIAEGLAFLHEGSERRIIHRDIKASNILLDKDMNAKISDFGLAKLFGEDRTHVSTGVAGTVGYMAPEYAMRGHLSCKTDVYSFGVLILEILRGRNNVYRLHDDIICLLDEANVFHEEGRLLDLVDPSLGADFNVEQATRILNLAMLCTDVSPTIRPTMPEVVGILQHKKPIALPVKRTRKMDFFPYCPSIQFTSRIESTSLEKDDHVSTDNGGSDDREVEVRLQSSCRLLGFDEKEGDRSPILAHDDITNSNVSLEDIPKKNEDPKVVMEVKSEEHAFGHEAVPPRKMQLSKSQGKLTIDQATTTDTADDSGIRLKVPYEFTGGEAKDHGNAGFLSLNYRNYLPSKRIEAMKVGDAGIMLQYFQQKQLENPLFFHAVQLDVDEKITNILWADARMQMDYGHFGDVVCFDTTYRISKEDRPFALFLGVNHHKQTIVFGAALLYDKTTESLKWLFQTFIEAMSGKVPKTILSDDDVAMAEAISLVLPKTYHRVCVWHIYQNAFKHLNHVFADSSSFTNDFSSLIYDHEDEDDFNRAWENILDKYKLRTNTWLQKLFEIRDKWALAYGRHAFCADMIDIQRSRNMNNLLRGYLNCQYDLLRFFKHFEMVLEDMRQEEIKVSFNVSQSSPKLPKMLKQTSEVYTEAAFEMFQDEYFEFLDCVIYNSSEDGTVSNYKVATDGKPSKHNVTFDSLDGKIVCSCKKFEFAGILCCHALKVLDNRNIKAVPCQYILKRWTKDAKAGIVRGRHGCTKQVDPKLEFSGRFQDLCHNFIKIAARAAEVGEVYTYALNCSDNMFQGMEEILKKISCEKYPRVITAKGKSANLR